MTTKTSINRMIICFFFVFFFLAILENNFFLTPWALFEPLMRKKKISNRFSVGVCCGEIFI